jgi:hypothetical protein
MQCSLCKEKGAVLVEERRNRHCYDCNSHLNILLRQIREKNYSEEEQKALLRLHIYYDDDEYLHDTPLRVKEVVSIMCQGRKREEYPFLMQNPDYVFTSEQTYACLLAYTHSLPPSEAELITYLRLQPEDLALHRNTCREQKMPWVYYLYSLSQEVKWYEDAGLLI